MTRTFIPPRLSARRATAILLVLAIVGGLAALLGSSLTSRTFTAERRVLIRVWNIDALVLSGQTTGVSASDLSDAATVMSSDDVISRAADSLDESAAELADAVTAVPGQTSAFVQLSVTGSTSREAGLRATAVADAFSSVVRIKVLSSARLIAGAVNSSGESVRSDIRVRAQAIGSVDPVQIYQTEPTRRSGLPTSTAVAAGSVGGLAVAALAVVLLAFAPPRLRRPADAARELGIPTATWRVTSLEGAGDGLVGQLRSAARSGEVFVCPATPADSQDAHDFASWLELPEDNPDGHEEIMTTSVSVVSAPVEFLPSAWPADDAASITVLVSQTGTRTDTVDRAIDLLARWRPVDAVILVG